MLIIFTVCSQFVHNPQFYPAVRAVHAHACGYVRAETKSP